MDSMEDVLSRQPWGVPYSESHTGSHVGWRKIDSWRGIHGESHYTFPAYFKLIKDTPGNFWSRGDIILFSSGFYNWSFESWKEWFLKKQDYLEALKNHPETHVDKRIPKYARLEFAMILSRYKWIKQKYYKTYYDYGSIIMMLTGSKAGHIRRYYLKTPYGRVSKYPYDCIDHYYKKRHGIKKVPQLKRIHEAMNYAKTKDEFILNMVASFHDKNYPMNLEENNESEQNFRII